MRIQFQRLYHSCVNIKRLIVNYRSFTLQSRKKIDFPTHVEDMPTSSLSLNPLVLIDWKYP